MPVPGITLYYNIGAYLEAQPMTPLEQHKTISTGKAE